MCKLALVLLKLFISIMFKGIYKGGIFTLHCFFSGVFFSYPVETRQLELARSLGEFEESRFVVQFPEMLHSPSVHSP